jgi:pyroglutamyl-peptidase
VGPERTILVAGFDPFGPFQRNPSGDLAVALDGSGLTGTRIVGGRLAVSWGLAWRQLDAAIEDVRPIGIILMGVAPTPFVRLEVLAMNAAFPERDVEGELPARQPRLRICQGAPAAYWSSFNLDELQKRLLEDGGLWGAPGAKGRVGVEQWAGAGSYLCNFVFFHALHRLGHRIPIAFVHIPPYEYMASEGALFSKEQVIAAAASLVKTGAEMVVEARAWQSPRPQATAIDESGRSAVSNEYLANAWRTAVGALRGSSAATSVQALLERMRRI